MHTHGAYTYMQAKRIHTHIFFKKNWDQALLDVYEQRGTFHYTFAMRIDQITLSDTPITHHMC